MPNMSHCRFENTAGDLEDCYVNMAHSNTKNLSANELRARKRLIELCVDIAIDHGWEVNEKAAKV